MAFENDPDLELWRRAQGRPLPGHAPQRDEQAFAQLQRKYAALVCAGLRAQFHKTRTLQDDLQDLTSADLEDLAQNLWSVIWRDLPEFRGDAKFSSWVYAYCRYVVLDWLKRKNRERLIVARVTQEMQDEASESERALESRIVVRDAIKNLEEKEREVIQLRFYERLTDSEIAERLQLTPGVVKHRIKMGLARLKASLQEFEGELK